MKTVKQILTAILALALIVAPQYADLIPAKFQVYAYVVLAVYEILARVIPTAKNWSILSQFIKLVQMVFPNASTAPKAKKFNTHD